MLDTSRPDPKAGRVLRKKESLSLVGIALALAAVSYSCTGDEEDGPTVHQGSGGMVSEPSGTGGDATGGTPVSVGSGGIPIDTGLDLDGSGTGGSVVGSEDFSECASRATEAQPLGIDMFVVLDHTTSMGSDCPLDLSTAPPPRSSKWCFASHALAEYFTSEASAGHRAALQYMSLADSVCEGGPENGQAHAAVGLTPLPSAADGPLVTSLSDEDPNTNYRTQIEAALRGIATFTAANRDPSRPMIGILITDGDPSLCDRNIDNLAAIVQEHYAATGIKTFIIGMTGATLQNLETMALPGGAPEHGPEFCGGTAQTCHYWSVGDGDPAAFVSALEQIQQAAVLPCEYQIPPAPAGEALRYDLVNIQYVDGAGVSTTLGYVASPEQCAGTSWYYDNPTAPTRIGLCPDACSLVSASLTGAQVDISYGCATIPQAT